MNVKESLANRSVLPEPGQMVLVRNRRYLVEDVALPSNVADASLVERSCVDDDAQRQALTVLWDHELHAQVLEETGWSTVAEKPFDDPELFAAYLCTLSWNCVTMYSHLASSITRALFIEGIAGKSKVSSNCL